MTPASDTMVRLAPSGTGRVYIATILPDGTIRVEDGFALTRRRAQAATVEAVAAIKALDLLAERIFVSKKRKPKCEPVETPKVEPPKIDEVARQKALRALRKGGFIPRKNP